MKLSGMKNLGKVAEEKLNEVGISTPDDLCKVGAENAFLQVRDLVDNGACLHFLTALEGAIEDVPKKDISNARKTELKDFYNSVQ
jgi:DNA transformation protein